MDVELALLVVAFHASTILAGVDERSARAASCVRRSRSCVAVLAGGTVGFHCPRRDVGTALYRTVVTTTLTGLDTKPESDSARGV